MKISRIVGYSMFGIVCMLLGIIIGMLSKTFYTMDMVNVDNETKEYVLEVSFKNRDILKLNTYSQINLRVNAAIDEVLLDLKAPIPLRSIFDRINKEKVSEKRKVIEELQKLLKNKEKGKIKI